MMLSLLSFAGSVYADVPVAAEPKVSQPFSIKNNTGIAFRVHMTGGGQSPQNPLINMYKDVAPNSTLPGSLSGPKDTLANLTYELTPLVNKLETGKPDDQKALYQIKLNDKGQFILDKAKDGGNKFRLQNTLGFKIHYTADVHGHKTNQNGNLGSGEVYIQDEQINSLKITQEADAKFVRDNKVDRGFRYKGGLGSLIIDVDKDSNFVFTFVEEAKKIS